MNLPAGFHWHEAPTPEIIALLNETTLRTNGARYRHLDTIDRIHEADHPLFLTLEWRERVLGNLTFCRRNQHWYIRYFAFHRSFQASKQTRQKQGDSRFKTGIKAFFETQLNAGDVDTFYAFIDPKNDRSKWMSENFGFSVIAQLATQSYSRVSPKASKRLSIVQDWNEIRLLVEQNYGKHHYFLTTHAEKPPFYVIKDELGEIIACTRVTRVHWEIVRLPGKWGGFLTKMIP
jgi:hypothetical protein